MSIRPKIWKVGPGKFGWGGIEFCG